MLSSTDDSVTRRILDRARNPSSNTAAGGGASGVVASYVGFSCPIGSGISSWRRSGFVCNDPTCSGIVLNGTQQRSLFPSFVTDVLDVGVRSRPYSTNLLVLSFSDAPQIRLRIPSIPSFQQSWVAYTAPISQNTSTRGATLFSLGFTLTIPPSESAALQTGEVKLELVVDLMDTKNKLQKQRAYFLDLRELVS